MVPCGDFLVTDLTVEGASHYISYGGFVNKNSCVTPDEIGAFPDPAPLDKLYATLRSSKGVPCLWRASANPGGPGHSWVRDRYVDRGPPMIPFNVDLGGGRFVQRVYIPSRVTDNKILMANDPTYVDRLRMTGDEKLVRAWLEGDWDVTLGQFYPEWRPSRHIIGERELPEHWTRFVAFDWGEKTPFSVLWIAVSDGIVPEFPDQALIVYREWYGATKDNKGLYMTPADVARGIIRREGGKEKISYRVADTQVFRSDGGPSIAEMMSPIGVYWQGADKERIAGWSQIRHRLRGDGFGTDTWRPMLYVMDNCPMLAKHIPILQIKESDPEDAMPSQQDHDVSALRYGCMSRPYRTRAKVSDAQRKLTLDYLFSIQKKVREDRLRGY